MDLNMSCFEVLGFAAQVMHLKPPMIQREIGILSSLPDDYLLDEATKKPIVTITTTGF